MRRKNTELSVWVNRILVIVTSISVIALVAMLAVAIYLSIGGSNKETAKQGFYAGETTVTQTDTTTSSQSNSTSESEGNGETITVQAGEGEASIAARAGISIAELERLNPQHMTTGSWYANPGDVVKIQ